ncbi:MAG: WD40 repeat domain-containing protein [Ktedonobacteraceae bacterium]
MFSGTALCTYRGHSEMVCDIAWSPDGMMIASGSYDQTVQVWSPTTGETLAVREGAGWLGTVTWSPDGTRLASTLESDEGNRVEIWEVQTGKRERLLGEFLGEVGDVSWSPDGLSLAACSWGGEVQMYTVATGEGGVIYTFDNNPGYAYAVDWSFDGAFLAASGDYGMVVVFQRHDWNPLLLLSPQRARVNDLAWLPRRYSLAAGDGNDICIWNVGTGETEAIYQGHTKTVFSVAASPDGHYLASGSGWDQAVHVWDLTTAQHLATFEGYSSQFHALAWSSDSTCLAFATEDDAITVMRVIE